ncbi:HNH endonuclease signature motif containing protein [Labrenzia sp. CE80]|uniref:HNH endonuclease n=1 Tax=Labrenzia sp. CE80 TaxID=1788986 RepID=UPI00129A7740|nr:HNH endonuclease signature motif containing protein [Labrenzia sp. CE80]
MKFGELTSREAVLDAISECDGLGRDAFLAKYGYKRARTYRLLHDGRIYDTKAIFGVAFGKQHGSPLRSRDFAGGAATVVPVFKRLGFRVSEVRHPAEELNVGATYFRKDLLDQFGGQMQRGIWTPAEFAAVFIFSGKSGEKYGYRDGWTEDGVFRYTGEGQTGDMTFTTGNAAIRDHRENNEDILLFEDLGKAKGVRYVGLFDIAGWEYVDGIDEGNNPRKLIVFSLVPLAGTIHSLIEPSITDRSTGSKISLGDLRLAAYSAANAGKSQLKSGNALTSWRERSATVRKYVLERAKGFCEACEQAAPFIKKDGSGYLEAHHIKRLADDGPDHPESVAAICPNCHRRIHAGEDGEAWNKMVQKKILAKEKRSVDT